MMNQSEFILPDSEYDWCLNNQVKILEPDSADYPKPYRNWHYRPHRLYYIGKPVWQTHMMLSVVGTRHPRPQSLTWLEDTLRPLVESLTLATVSGGARGVDQKTHQISMWQKKPTVVFLPSGLACPYPENIRDWFRPVIENGGAIVSQFRPFMHMQKSYFSERNRMIAALSPLTLLIECKRRSGTVLTAKHALEYGSDLAVMPTSPDLPGLGGLELVQGGHAKLVMNSQDLVRVYHEALLRQAKQT